MVIEKILAQDEQVTQVKESVIPYIIILICSVVSGYLSLMFPDNGNISFALIFIGATLLLFSLKGFIFPKKLYKHKLSNKKILKKEFYFDRQELKEIEKCMGSQKLADGIKILELLPKKGTNIRVIIYSTKDYSYYKYQIQQYIPYEYVPL